MSDHSKFFPGKLRIMLDQVDGLGLSNGASWVSEGHAFAIHDPDVFMKQIAPKFFSHQSHIRSFHRQLSIWGFTRLETGTGGRGVWFHKNFDRDRPDVIKLIKRVPVKNPKTTVQTVSKNGVPDYSNYQLPQTFNNDAPNATVAKPSPVRQQPMPNVAAVAAPQSGSLPMGGNMMSGTIPQGGNLDYLAAFRGMPYGRQSLPANLPQGFNPAMLASNFQPTAAAMGMNDINLAQLLQRPQGAMGGVPPQGAMGGVPPQGAMGGLPQQNLGGVPQGSIGGGDGNNINPSMLSMMKPPASMAPTATAPAPANAAAAVKNEETPAAEAASNEALLAELAKRNLQPPPQEPPTTAALSNEELLAALAKRNIFPGGAAKSS